MTVDPNTRLETLGRAPTLARKAYDALKEAIVTGALQPDTDHTEVGLARTLGISRAPLREAVRQLQEEGFLDESSSRAGVTVSPITRQSVSDLYALRKALECMAAAASAGHIPAEQVTHMDAVMRQINPTADDDYVQAIRSTDFAFHDLWVRNAGNRLMERHIDRLRDHLLRVSYHIPMNRDHYERSHTEHLEILSALRSDDEQSYVQAVEAHIVGVAERVLTLMRD